MSKPANNVRARGSRPGTLKRLVKMLFSFYPVLLPLVMLGVVLCALINSIGSVFLQKALEVISTSWQTGDWAAARPQILGLVTTPRRHLHHRQPVLALLEPLHGRRHAGLAHEAA